MRILVESPNCNAFAGSNAAVGYGWVTRLAARHEMHVVVYDGRYDAGHPGGVAPEVEGVHPIRIAPTKLARAGTLADFVVAARRRRAELIARVKPDLVHSLEPSGWPGPRALVTARVPSVLGPLTGGGALPARSFSRAVLDALPVSPARAMTAGGIRKAAVNVLNETVFGGTPVARAAARRAMRVSRAIVLGTEISPGAIPAELGARVHRVPLTGIDAAAFAPAPKAAERTLLYAGRIVAIKCLHLLIEAMPRIEGVLRVAGAAPPEESWYEEHCRARAHVLGVQDRIEWLGHLDRAALCAEYAGAHVTCMLSLWDTFGLTYLESMASGTPVIALRTGGAPEIVAAGSGWLIPPESPGAVVDAVASVLGSVGDPELADAGARAREHAVATFAWDALVDRMDAVYQGIAR